MPPTPPSTNGRTPAPSATRTPGGSAAKPPVPVSSRSVSFKQSMGEIGRTGLRRTGGFIEGDEFLLQLANERKYRVFREMRENDPVINAIVFAVEMLIRQVDWRMEVDEKDTAGQEAADFLDECREDMTETWCNPMAELLSFIVCGWSYFEIC